MKSRIILASASPRRKELLKRAGIDFEVQVSDVEETFESTKPDEIVKELSYIKARDVWEKTLAQDANMQSQDVNIQSQATNMQSQDIIVLGADTIVAKEGDVMGKPESEDEAYEMIDSIQGDTHQVYTGVTIVWGDGEHISFAEKTDVTVYAMTKEEIEDYIATGEPMDKAGAYGIQGIFGKFIKEIKGDYSNVVGLPVGRVYQELKALIER